jgi:hypothetical protein
VSGRVLERRLGLGDDRVDGGVVGAEPTEFRSRDLALRDGLGDVLASPETGRV